MEDYGVGIEVLIRPQDLDQEGLIWPMPCLVFANVRSERRKVLKGWSCYLNNSNCFGNSWKLIRCRGVTPISRMAFLWAIVG
jgi:hypothetical protein